MPRTEVYFYVEDTGRIPVLDWLMDLRRREPRAYAKCRIRIERLEELGYDLHRPEADYLRDGIYELRARYRRVNCRILYFFHGQRVAVLASALTKEDKVPDAQVGRALRRKEQVESDPDRFILRETESHD